MRSFRKFAVAAAVATATAVGLSGVVQAAPPPQPKTGPGSLVPGVTKPAPKPPVIVQPAPKPQPKPPVSPKTGPGSSPIK